MILSDLAKSSMTRSIARSLRQLSFLLESVRLKWSYISITQKLLWEPENHRLLF